jgi:Tol biopolymer transport system component
MGTPKISFDPSWSPSGDRLAFAEYNGVDNVDIWTARADGSARNRVTNSSAPDFGTAWS